ncbi:DUF2808 domain-containing protein [Gloeothece verrucosa]|uniref:DUF2808 domain-containing protein n=1 Tax=Gloeothece verrucosa (strain PCC 7822) TaxID=497965 RepID=E0UJA1_GLOV7|nr:DUF2808 domain-containing protein [Gloeothece verrucosa]ADN15804.1 hypothetical protein Cyan7822_3873 [Gloeothece verrucosa PCC 7822]
MSRFFDHMNHHLRVLTILLTSGIVLLNISQTTDILAQDITQQPQPTSYQVPSFFLKSPTLIRSATSAKGPASEANYHFTIQVPSNAGQPLKSVTIIQQLNVEKIRFLPQGSQAFIGQSFHRGTPVAVQGELIENDTDGVKVIFNEPILPGNTVTVVLRAINPLYGGVYQFGVTAFPEGNDQQGLYLGPGRLHFSMPGGSS